jgi:hypothetical protein
MFMNKNIHRTKEVITAGEKEISNETEEETTSWIASIPSYVAVLTAVVALITAIVAVANYRQQSAKDISAREFDAQKPFFEKQTEFYVDAMQTVSKIATKDSPAKDDVDHFWELYYGRLAAVEDTLVDRVMVQFGEMLAKKSSSGCLKNTSLLLAHCVKKSWGDTWKVTLGDPPELPCDEGSFRKLKVCTAPK